MDSTPQPQTPSQAPTQTPRPPRGKHLLIIAAIVLFCVAAVFEVSARLWLANGKGVPHGQPRSAILGYYPELKPSLAAAISRGDKAYHVLILGDSLFADAFGGLGGEVKRQLEAKGVKNVRIWNISASADTTRDSLVKYRWLEGRHFKWVIVCQGPNELLVDGVPDKQMRKDYTHLGWYAEAASVADHPRNSSFASPLLWDYIKFKFRSPVKAAPRPVLSAAPGRGKQTLTDAGATFLAECYRDNLEKIADLAKKRRDYLTLATAPSFLDPKYTAERLEHDRKIRADHTSGTLELSYAGADYAAKALPCEAWGRPQDLTLGLGKTNEALRLMARKRKISLADLATSVSARGANFIDVCHLSPAGVTEAARALVALAPLPEGAAAPAAKPSAPAKKAASPQAGAPVAPAPKK